MAPPVPGPESSSNSSVISSQQPAATGNGNRSNKPPAPPRKVAKATAVPKAKSSPPLKAAPAQPARAQAVAKSSVPLLVVEEEPPRRTWRELVIMAPSWLISMLVHALLLIILALMVLPSENTFQAALSALNTDDEAVENIEEEFEELDPPEPVDLTETVEATVDTEVEQSEAVDVSNFQDDSAAKLDMKLNEMGEIKVLAENLTDRIGTVSGNALSGRGSGKARLRAAVAGGGGKDTEAAVARALQWIARHQLPNGAWSFDHRLANHPNGKDPGRLRDAYNGATGLALMCFLGAGHTHKKGKYKNTVRRGLYYLVGRMNRQTGSLHEPGGNMYSHGIAAIALCEAYAMTRDRGLRGPAQAAVNFICYAQDPVGGGWRYQPRSPGDTSVVGWQFMALKSGHMAYLAIPPKTIQGAIHFLNSVQTDSGAFYGYTSPGRGPATTAVGLLCRMYTGWKHEEPALQRGVEALLKMQDRQKRNPYFYYYAAQVLHHYGGEEWEQWNRKMRPWLVETQEKEGHEAGSWYFGGGHANEAGGRHYVTCLNCMTLEVYYRYSPIYKKKSVEDEFEE